MQKFLMGMALSILATGASADSLLDATTDPLSMKPVDLEAANLPFPGEADVFRMGIYQQIPLDRLVESGMVGSRHDLKVIFHSDKTLVEVPGYRVRYDTILGYNPEVDEVRPYQEEFDPDIRYRLSDGAFKLWGDALGACDDVRSIFSSGSYLYLEMVEGGKGVECAVDGLLMAHGLFRFHERDRPEMYEVERISSGDGDESSSDEINMQSENIIY